MTAPNILSRIADIESKLNEREIVRLANHAQNLELALEKKYGHRLNPMAVLNLKDQLILRPEFVAAVITGTDSELPSTVQEWENLAIEMVDSDDLARGSVVSSDQTQSATIRRELLEEMRLDDRILMGREGTLDELIEEKVQIKLNDRTGL